jgi:dienelactone hydrolase
MPRHASVGLLLCLATAPSLLRAGEARELDPRTREQATLEQEQMAAGKPHEFTASMADFRRTAEVVEYPSGQYKLPGYLYKPAGAGPFPAVIWNHGSEKNPGAQPELACFYTHRGFVFFVPIRHGHGRAPGPYIGDLQKELRDSETDASVVQKKIVDLLELYNGDVVAAVEWLKKQPFVDSERMVMSGVSYGGIQTVLAAEKGLGMRAFMPFAPAAMSYRNKVLRERLLLATRNAKAPMFLLQAKNDYSTGPSELLAPILEKCSHSSKSKVYAAFGTTNQEGHGAFATRSLGVTLWGNDVLDFVEASMQGDRPQTKRAAQ